MKAGPDTGVGFMALFDVAVVNGVIMLANLDRLGEPGVPLMQAGRHRRQRVPAAGGEPNAFMQVRCVGRD
jgi:hypothetical protein